MSSKYRILIVEDEEIECSALAVMLKYNRQDIQEIRTAANGIEALEIYRTFAPDIVLMDINLPGVNGLNVIRQMQMLKQNAYFVIVSAHSQFSYAQEAMRLDVTDFLVKPIRLEDINRVMNELVQQISHKRTQNETALRQQEKIEAIRPILERDCVLSVASMRSNTPIATIFDFMQIPVTFGFVFTVREKGMGAALLREIKSGMGNMGVCCIGEILNDICVCIALSSDQIRPEQIQEVMTHLSTVLKAKGHHCRIGVGSVADSADNLRLSYEQAMETFREAARAGESLLFSTASVQKEQSSLSNVSVAAAEICKSILAGQPEEVSQMVQNFVRTLQFIGDYHQVQEGAYCLYIMVLGHFSGKTEGVSLLSAGQIFAMQDIRALEMALTQSFLNLIEEKNPEKIVKSNQIVSKAIQLVKQRFRENITLDIVAEELGVSSFYLSKLFHKHTGMNFTEYLTQKRIAQAKRLLENGEMNIKEIAYATGFNSQSYFSKIFKKYVGIAPSDYKGADDASE